MPLETMEFQNPEDYKARIIEKVHPGYIEYSILFKGNSVAIMLKSKYLWKALDEVQMNYKLNRKTDIYY